jgi:hypothetical protein
MKAWIRALPILVIALFLVLGISLAVHARISTTSASKANPNNDEVNEQYPENDTNQHIGVNEQPESADNEQWGVNEQYPKDADNEQLEVNEHYPDDNTCENHLWNWGNICENRWED